MREEPDVVGERLARIGAARPFRHGEQRALGARVD
jgi:hypothetical protein